MNTSLTSTLKPLKRFFDSYHSTIFFATTFLILAGAILSLYLTIHEDTPEMSTTSTVRTTFDEKTAEEIKKYRESNEVTTNLVIPSPRSNPFVE